MTVKHSEYTRITARSLESAIEWLDHLREQVARWESGVYKAPGNDFKEAHKQIMDARKRVAKQEELVEYLSLKDDVPGEIARRLEQVGLHWVRKVDEAPLDSWGIEGSSVTWVYSPTPLLDNGEMYGLPALLQITSNGLGVENNKVLWMISHVVDFGEDQIALSVNRIIGAYFTGK